MSTTEIPTSPKQAFKAAQKMAKELGVSIITLADKADVAPSTVYRWRTNKTTYSMPLFNNLKRYHRDRLRRLRAA